MPHPLLERRIGLQIVSKVIWVGRCPGIRASWPFGKIQLFQEELVLCLFSKKITIPYRDIESLERKWFYIQIHHHALGVDPYVYISGMLFGGSLYGAIKKTLSRYHLPVICM